MRQIFKTHPWVPPKELPETQELFRKYGVPGSIRPGHLLKGKGEPSKLYLITRGAAAYYVADRYKSHPSVLSLLIPGCSACDLSVITGDRVNVTTRAIGPCEVLIMQPHVLEKQQRICRQGGRARHPETRVFSGSNGRQLHTGTSRTSKAFP